MPENSYSYMKKLLPGDNIYLDWWSKKYQLILIPRDLLQGLKQWRLTSVAILCIGTQYYNNFHGTKDG